MITIEINDAAVTAALGKLESQLSDLSSVMEGIGEMLVRSTKQRFEALTSPQGMPWAANSPVTLAHKRDHRPLHGLSGALSSQIFHEAGRDYVAVGSNRIYAATMQFGAAQGAFGARMGRTQKTDKVKSHDYFFPIPWGDIPARPFLGLSDQDERDILDEIAEAMAVAMGD